MVRDVRSDVFVTVVLVTQRLVNVCVWLAEPDRNALNVSTCIIIIIDQIPACMQTMCIGMQVHWLDICNTAS